MTALQRLAPLLGRVLIAAIFLYSGWGKATGFANTVTSIAGKGLPMPQLLAGAATAVELLGGLLLVIGWKTRWAAAALFVFTGVAAFFFHNFWAVDAAQMRGQLIHFMKNLAIMGGLLYVIAYGSGGIGVDGGGTTKRSR